jgi:hypothetical protein
LQYLLAESFFAAIEIHWAGVAELADARVSKTRSDKEYRFDSDHPHQQFA